MRTVHRRCSCIKTEISWNCTVTICITRADASSSIRAEFNAGRDKCDDRSDTRRRASIHTCQRENVEYGLSASADLTEVAVSLYVCRHDDKSDEIGPVVRERWGAKDDKRQRSNTKEKRGQKTAPMLLNRIRARMASVIDHWSQRKDDGKSRRYGWNASVQEWRIIDRSHITQCLSPKQKRLHIFFWCFI